MHQLKQKESVLPLCGKGLGTSGFRCWGEMCFVG